MPKYIYLFLLSLIIVSCDNDENANLSSADDRVSNAVEELRDKLIAPDNGWVLNYKPNVDGGSYYILLDFDEDEVRVQSDVPYEDGYLYDLTIPYKIDAQLQLALTFESYAVFHYLFEQEQSTFGAEFEFYFVEDSNGELMFQSKTDETLPVSSMTMVPASSNASGVFAFEQAENVPFFEIYNQPFGTDVIQQLYMSDDSISVFWVIDFLNRTIDLDAAAVGETNAEIGTTNIITELNGTIGFSYGSESILFEESIDFSLNGKSYSFSSVRLNDFAYSGEIYCSTSSDVSPIYAGSIDGVGACELRHSLYKSTGRNFVQQTESSYSVNVFFVGDSTGISFTSEDEVIGINYPEASGFIFSYGLEDEEDLLLENAIGITYSDEDGIIQTDYRGFDATTLVGNMLQVTLNESFYFTKDNPTSEDEDRIRAVTDEVIGNGELYVSEWEGVSDDFVVFRLFNPCNGNEFALVEP